MLTPSELYESDALAWAEQQAAILRRLAAGERVDDAVDWTRVIEEVANVGLSELRACRSLLVQAMTHLLKLHLDPDSPSAAHRRGEVVVFLSDAGMSLTSSMRRRPSLTALWSVVLRRMQAEGLLTHHEKLMWSKKGCSYTLDAPWTPRRTSWRWWDTWPPSPS